MWPVPFSNNEEEIEEPVCPVCFHPFNPLSSKSQILKETSETKLLLTNCSKCRINLLALLFPLPPGCLVVPTDLSAEEILNLDFTKNVNADDVIDIHKYFKNFKNKI